SIIQHKAIKFAQAHGVEIELGRFNGSNPTRIGAGDTRISSHADHPIPLTLAICGAGVVGGGLLDLVEQLPELFQITGVARRSPGRSARNAAYPITNDAIKLAESGADVIVELIGGTSTALEIAQSALRCGSSLVTANKSLIAEHGVSLHALRDHSDQQILFSASVGGAMPLLEAIRGREIQSVTGVLNGTTNYVLGQLERGRSLGAAVQDAQTHGYAEADASRDLDGRDALDKLMVIANEQRWSIPDSHITLEPIPAWLSTAHEPYPARHVAHVDHRSASVTVQPLQSFPELANTRDEWNHAEVQLTEGHRITVRGKGAGRWPTSESVLADLLELSRTHSDRTSKEALCHA
ncbi:MAG: homoserine dehydrogenase, partial [Phycisphaerales bacterium]